ncbi:pyridoxamine 5'-phosphate oxidase family protein [Natronoarchaeum rubrum]|uniref:pyridoxamine 5'-phosphate oxidase family protein n=1 Tax=Natronoarchaeum rubrum TaxID=755311 RepID=UPI00211252DF|nr:pyridoxamine 5'-phosphate oxidase family protein [Natronoarchaeum rubrum]
MDSIRWAKLSDDELDEFLDDGGTGVISFSTAADEPPFTVPVSYGYYADERQFYFRLSFPDEGGKAEFLDHPVAFVAHGREDGQWRSAVATGQLEEVSDAPYESMQVQGLWAVRIPRVDIFDRPPEDVPFRDFRLVPDTLDGRKEFRSDAES